MRIIFTRRAERHIDALHAYIADKTSEIRADAYIARIVAFCANLTTLGASAMIFCPACVRSGSSGGLPSHL